MEIISPFPLGSSLNLDFNSDRDFRVSISGQSSASDSFSTPSSTYGAFTPTSGRSSPHKPVDLDTASCPQNVFFDMNPLPQYVAGSLSPECKSDLVRFDYLGPCVSDGLPARQSVEAVPAGMGYGDYVEMSMPQSYSTSAPADPAVYEMYPMGNRYRPRQMDSAAATSTVCMSDMCNNEPYDLSSSMINRLSISSMAAFPGDHYRGSDTESVGSHSVMSPMGSLPSPDLPQRLAMANLNERAGGPKRARGPSSGRRASIDQALMGPPESGDAENLGPIEIKRISAGGFKCDFPDCNKSFNRREHLKRHVKATHEEAKIECPFCTEKREKPFNRHDNFKQHIKMHAQRRSHGRVEFNPEALDYYHALLQNTKPRNHRRGAPAARRSSAQRPRRDGLGSFTDLRDSTI